MPTPAQRKTLATAAAATAGLGLTVGGFHYAALWPASQLFGRSLIAGDDPQQVALTFDDGPNPRNTAQLLELLASHHAPAAFFVIGERVRQYPAIVRAVHDAGHLVGCHTMTHPRLMYLPAARIRDEVQRATTLIEDTLGARVRYFRPPFGGRNPAMFQVLRQLELTPVLWNVNPRDWKAASAQQILQRIHSGIARNQRRSRGSNVLMHDGSHLDPQADRTRTIMATAALLAGDSRSALQFVTLDAWGLAAAGFDAINPG